MVTGLWTPEQIILSLLVVLACAVLALARMSSVGDGVGILPAPFSPWPSRLVVLTLLAVAVFLALRSGNPIGVRMDSWSDANVVVSGRNYARMGLFSNYGAPQHQVVTDTNPNDPFFVYTRYPVAANLINGLWQIAGVTSVRAFRALPAACSILAVLAWFRVYARFIGRAVAALAAMIFATSFGFLSYADNLHFHGYAMLTTAGAVLAFVRAMDADRLGRRRWLALCTACVFVGALFTWEYHLWLLVFFALYSILFRSARQTDIGGSPADAQPLGANTIFAPAVRPEALRSMRYAFWMTLPLLLAFALLALQRRAASPATGVGGFSDAASGFLQDLYRRTIGFASATDRAEIGDQLAYPFQLALNFYLFYGVPLVAAAAVTTMLILADLRPRKGPRGLTPGTRLLLALIAAGCAWWMVMMQHTSVHLHVLRHAVPAYALLLAMCWQRCWRILRGDDIPLITRMAAIALMLALAYPHFEGSWCNIRLHFQRDFTDDRRREEARRDEGPVLAGIRELVPHGGVILTNHNRIPPMRLWSERPVYAATLMRYPPDDQANGRQVLEMIFNHLRELYHESLPPLYYVYAPWIADLETAFERDGILQLLLIGGEPKQPDSWRARARPALTEAMEAGRSDQSFCPILGHTGTMIVFHLGPAVPDLMKAFGSKPPPRLEDLGPAP